MFKTPRILALSAALLTLAATPALAESPHHDSGIMPTTNAKQPTDLFAKSRSDMHKGMDVKATGNADVDFVKNMIPHHQGAIDMAKVAFQNGQDPAIRKLAADIIKAQEKEIKMMQDWLKKNEKKK